MRNAFESWMGQPVIVRLAWGHVKLSLCGMVLKEETDTLLMRPHSGPDLEICKTKVLAIEEIGDRAAALLFPKEVRFRRKSA
jgi:hypothetical protein